MNEEPAALEGSLFHGYRGQPDPSVGPNPCGFVVGVNRQAGARGSTIATEAAARLGWPVYTPEMIDFMARDEATLQELLAGMPTASQLWLDHQHQQLLRLRNLAPGSDSVAVARLVYILAVRGQAVIVGRGAGFLLPAETTLHARIVAPRSERIAYMSQWLRLTEAEAAEEVTNRDARRAAFTKPFTDQPLDDLTAYDLILNSGRMPVAVAAELIANAMEAKQKARQAGTDSMDGSGELSL